MPLGSPQGSPVYAFPAGRGVKKSARFVALPRPKPRLAAARAARRGRDAGHLSRHARTFLATEKEETTEHWLAARKRSHKGRFTVAQRRGAART